MLGLKLNHVSKRGHRCFVLKGSWISPVKATSIIEKKYGSSVLSGKHLTFTIFCCMIGEIYVVFTMFRYFLQARIQAHGNERVTHIGGCNDLRQLRLILLVHRWCRICYAKTFTKAVYEYPLCILQLCSLFMSRWLAICSAIVAVSIPYRHRCY